MVVVFDGDAASEQVSYERRICIIYSRHDETADSVIARLAAEARQAGREVEMYSNDAEVQQAVSRQGGGVYAADQLTRQLNAPPRDVARRYHHRLAQGRKYGLGVSPFDDKDGPEPQRATKSGKRKSSGWRK